MTEKELFDQALRDWEEKNYPAAAAVFSQLAEGGDTAAMCKLGQAYASGFGVDKDNKTGYRWISRAADAGDVEGMFLRGQCYEYGVGVEKNAVSAFIWYKKAAEMGHAMSQRMVGSCFFYGRGTSLNDRVAIDWFRRSVKNGDATAAEFMYWVLRTGITVVVKKDIEQAFSYCVLAADRGLASSMAYLADYFLFGIPPMEKNVDKALEWLRKAESMGDGHAYTRLGYCHEFGIGVPVDYEKAAQYFLAAQKQNLSDGWCYYGKLLMEGKGVKKDEKYAFYCFKKAVEIRDNKVAMNEIGLCYLYGCAGQKINYPLAFKIFRKALLAGNVDAKESIATMYELGLGTRKYGVRAQKLREEAKIGRKRYVPFQE